MAPEFFTAVKGGKIKLYYFIFCAFFLASCFLGGFWGTSGSGSFFLAGIRLTGAGFVLIYSLIWVMSLLVFLYAPSNLSFKENLRLILILAIAARILVFFQSPSDDMYRYIWEGLLINHGVNPYVLSPDNTALAQLASKFSFHALINHPGITAAYPPMMLSFFSVMASVSLSPYFFKIFMVIFDLLGIVFLAFILQKRKIHIKWAILYCLNPLILYSFAGEGHFDSLQTFFLLGAVFFYDRKKWIPLFLFAGLAVQVKYVAVLALPFLVNKNNFKFSFIAALPIIVFYLPFSLENFGDMFKGLIAFEGEFAFNGAIHSILRVISGDIRSATIVCRIMFVVFMLFGILKLNGLKTNCKAKQYDPVKGIFYSFSCLLLFSPTVHIWYLSWIFPFAIIRNISSWFILTLSAGLYFITKSIVWLGGDWRLPVWAQILEWIPFFTFFIFELYYSLIRKDLHEEPLPEKVSVVIPALNEAGNIKKCIDSIKKYSAVCEIIVVDGGSSDETKNIAEASGAMIFIHSRQYENGGGRGAQIKKGIDNAKGDVVAVIHADTEINQDIFSMMIDVLTANSDISGGAVGVRFDKSFLKINIVDFLNRIRALFFGISFGDQIQFFRRKIVFENKLFPDMPLMEDVEFSIMLPKAGRRVFLFGDVMVSARRWQNEGSGNFVKVLKLFFIYICMRAYTKPDVVKMYKDYYNK